LKFSRIECVSALYRSPPTRGRGLKLVIDHHNKTKGFKSPPTRGRGLK